MEEEKKRRGRQEPTVSYILPYTETLGKTAIDLYNSTGRTAQEWQELMLYDIMAVNDDGLWTHTKYGYSIPRRNGKSEVLEIREMIGLVNGEKILHTAHRTSTSHSSWERIIELLRNAGYKEGKTEDYSTLKQLGFEKITMNKTGGVINYRTRSTKGGLGEGYDLLIIDEAQEYQVDQETALKYVVSDSKNPQTIMCGTPPTPLSSGTVFTSLRKSILSGKSEHAGWAEWSVEDECDPNDREKWYETNPSLGTILTERTVADEIGDDVIDFNIQRLGLWLKYNQKSAISKREWEVLKVDALPKFAGRLTFGIKFNRDGSTVALGLAVKTTDGKVFVEAIDCKLMRDGVDWIVSYLKRCESKTNKIIVDGKNGQKLMADAMKDARIKGMILPTVSEVINANTTFEQRVFRQELCHNGQPGLEHVVSNCEKRAIGSGGGFGYKSIRTSADIALMDAVILAQWGAMEYDDKPHVQRINY